MLPGFLVIGAMKAGTTSLFHYLSDHPEIVMPWQKELDFFSNEANWARGVEWYQEQFGALASDGVVAGEASPNYSKRHLFPATVDRIAATLPEVRIIYLIRDPVERLQSMYVDMCAYGGEERRIDEAVAADDDYVLTSCYGYQLEPYVEAFGQERVLVVAAEDLRRRTAEVMGTVHGFVGVEPTFQSPRLGELANPRAAKKVGATTGDQLDVSLSDDILEHLRSRFVEDRALLDRLLDATNGPLR